MLAVEQLQRVVDPELLELGGEGLGPEVEVPLVAAAGIEVDAAHRAQRVGVPRRHSHRVELQPPLPDLVHEAPRGDLEGQQRLAGAIGIGREAGRASVVHQRVAEPVHVEAVGLGEALEEDLVGALELVAQLARGLAGSLGCRSTRTARPRRARRAPRRRPGASSAPPSPRSRPRTCRRCRGGRGRRPSGSGRRRTAPPRRTGSPGSGRSRWSSGTGSRRTRSRQSTKTTIASGHSPAANIASTRSNTFGSKGSRRHQESSWPK